MTDTVATFDESEIIAIREKYRSERDKRLRDDGNDQYIEVTGEYSSYVEDPYIDQPIVREPRTDQVDVVVVGGGFGGLLTAGNLRESGIDDLMVIEKGGDFGGTWYWNRYPGAMCDIESYTYLPLLEELGSMPSEKYVKAKEILAHSAAIGRHYDLYERTLFQTEVTEVRWNEERQRWIVSTDRGDAVEARFVAMANGPLHRPKLPGIAGINDYRGHTFHTSRWDYEYTGGDPEGGLDRIADKRIAVIGTGATAIQCVPHLGAGAKELFVFQRTPSCVDERNNVPTDEEWAASLEPGWQMQRMENFNNLVSGIPEPVDLVNDGWTDIIGKTVRLVREGRDNPNLDVASLVERADLEKMNEIRSRVDTLVGDPAIAESLKPWYRQFCKRPCFHDEYLDTYNRPTVHLVDTDGRGVKRITETGIVIADPNGGPDDELEFEVDCIVFATGFEVGTDHSRRAGYEVFGRDGRSITEHWADGTRTLHGLMSHGFPNAFIISPSQGGFTANYPHMLLEVSAHIAHIAGHALNNDLATVEPTVEAEEAWIAKIIEKARQNMAFSESCTPGYYNNEGQPGKRSLQNSSYGSGSKSFFRILERWRDEGEFAGLDMR